MSIDNSRSLANCAMDGRTLHSVAHQVLESHTACKAACLFEYEVRRHFPDASDDAVKLAWAFAKIAEDQRDRIAGASGLSDGVPLRLRLPLGLDVELRKCAHSRHRTVEREALAWLIEASGSNAGMRRSREAVEWYEILLEVAGAEAIGHDEARDEILRMRKRAHTLFA